VVVLVGGGPSNAEIAERLLMSEGTAKAHVSRILTKLDCTNGYRPPSWPTTPGSCRRCRAGAAVLGGPGRPITQSAA